MFVRFRVTESTALSMSPYSQSLSILRFSLRRRASSIFELMSFSLFLAHTIRWGASFHFWRGRYLGTVPVPSGNSASRSACAPAEPASRVRTKSSEPRAAGAVRDVRIGWTPELEGGHERTDVG